MKKLGEGVYAAVILVETTKGFLVVKVPTLRDIPYELEEGVYTLQKYHTSYRDAIPLALDHKGIIKIHFVVAVRLERISGGPYSLEIKKITKFEYALGMDVLLTVMPYGSEKMSLSHVLDKGPISSEKILQIAKALLKALRHLHEKGFAHHDLKPANILLDDKGEVTVIDFGLSTGINEKTSLGTCAYSSPEQFDGEISGDSHDIFSFGVTMFESKHDIYPFPTNYSKNGCHLRGINNDLGIYGIGENIDLYDEGDPVCKLICCATQSNPSTRPSAARLSEILEELLVKENDVGQGALELEFVKALEPPYGGGGRVPLAILEGPQLGMKRGRSSGGDEPLQKKAKNL